MTRYKIEEKDGAKHLIEKNPWVGDLDRGELHKSSLDPNKSFTRNINGGANFELEDKSGLFPILSHTSREDKHEVTITSIFGKEKGTMERPLSASMTRYENFYEYKKEERGKDRDSPRGVTREQATNIEIDDPETGGYSYASESTERHLGTTTRHHRNVGSTITEVEKTTEVEERVFQISRYDTPKSIGAAIERADLVGRPYTSFRFPITKYSLKYRCTCCGREWYEERLITKYETTECKYGCTDYSSLRSFLIRGLIFLFTGKEPYGVGELIESEDITP